MYFQEKFTVGIGDGANGFVIDGDGGIYNGIAFSLVDYFTGKEKVFNRDGVGFMFSIFRFVNYFLNNDLVFQF